MTASTLPKLPEATPQTPRRGIGALIGRFFGWNKRAARRLKPALSPGDVELYNLEDQLIVEYAAKAPTPVLVDVGGGRTCSFAAQVERTPATRIVAVDISQEELDNNHDVDEGRVADVCESMPFADGEAGMIVSRTLVEHLPDVDAFFGHVARSLAPGGHTIHLVPGRNSLFAIAGRIVPFPIAKRILHFLRPEMKGIVEFPVYYDRCTPKLLRESLERHGLEVVELHVTYSQADYFDALLPAYVVVGLYEKLLALVGARNLAAYTLVVARKP